MTHPYFYLPLCRLWRLFLILALLGGSCLLATPGHALPQVPLAGNGSLTPSSGPAPGAGLTWDILQSGATVATNTTPNGWSVSYVNVLLISAPGTATVGDATLRYKVSASVFIGGDFSVVQPAASLRSGSPYPWERSIGRDPGNSVNTVNGNKTTSLPLVAWTARGGLPVELTLVHNSQSSQNTTLGQKWTHSYDLYGLTDGSGNFTVHWGDDLSYKFTKNANGSFTAPTGIHDTLVKNADGTYLLTRPNQVKYAFNTALRCTSIKDANNNTITLGYSGNLVTSVTDPTSRTLTFTYTSNRISSITDPLSRVWTLYYDGSARLTSVDLPALSGTTYSVVYSYNSSHCITDIQMPRGYHWTFGYNADNSLAWEKDPYNSQTSYSYTSSTRTVTDPNGNQTIFTYSSGRLTQIKDALNQHEDYTYDSANHVTQVTDKRGYNWQYTYDSSGNVLTTKDPGLNTTTYTYSSHNRPLTETLPTGEQTVCSYDTNDNLTSLVSKDAGGTTKATLTYTIGSWGQRTDYYDANNHRYQYGYDSHGRLSSVTTPLSNVTAWSYDALDRCTSRTDALTQQTTYAWDAWGRLTTTTYPDTSTHTFAYDINNNLTQFVDSAGTTTRAYDNADRLLSESKGGTTLVSYTYDATGKKGLLSTLTDVNSRTITYSYTTRNEIASVADSAGTASYTYDANGNETAITNPNGTTVTKGYNTSSRLTSVTNKTSGGSVLSSFSYVLDANHRPSQCTEANGDVLTYGYDWGGRLVSESRTGTNAYTCSYTLDPVGNRLSQTLNGTTTTYTLNAEDAVTATSGGFANSYSYNANGEQTARTLAGTAYTLDYDYDGQLITVTQGGSAIAFDYDALGRRVSRTSGGVTTTFLHTGDVVLVEKQGTTTTAVYTHGNALVRKDGEYPLFDGIGSERTVTNSSQSVIGAITFEAFGGVVATSGSSASPYMFAATSRLRTEGIAGLIQADRGPYDPQLGRIHRRAPSPFLLSPMER